MSGIGEVRVDEDKVQTEARACGLCGSTRSRLWLRTDNLRRGTKRFFDVVECADCSFRFTSPSPTLESMRLYYPEHYESWQGGRLGLPLRVYYRLFRAIRRPPGKLLDIGCGDGRYLYLMRELGWTGHGQDISPVPDAVTKDFPFFRGEVQDAPFPAESFDVITSWFSIEHLRDPLRSLKKCHELLKPGGLIAIDTSNSDSLEASLFGRYWHHLLVPEHYWQFTEASLRRMAEAAGFRVLYVRHDALSFGFINSLQLMLKDRGIPLRISNPLTKLLSVPLDLAAAAMRRSALITLYAVK